jgi:hypothetical protein
VLCYGRRRVMAAPRPSDTGRAAAFAGGVAGRPRGVVGGRRAAIAAARASTTLPTAAFCRGRGPPSDARLTRRGGRRPNLTQRTVWRLYFYRPPHWCGNRMAPHGQAPRATDRLAVGQRRGGHSAAEHHGRHAPLEGCEGEGSAAASRPAAAPRSRAPCHTGDRTGEALN